MIQLTKRQRDLLIYIIGSNEVISTNELSEQFSVSKRAIRYDIDILDTWLKEHKILLAKESRKGIRLNVTTQEKKMLLGKLSQNDEKVLSKEERRYFIMIRLLLVKDFITLSELSKELYVSKNTIISDLAYVDNIFQIHGISIIRKQKYGIKLSGEEIKIRNTLFNLVREIIQKSIVGNQGLSHFFQDAKIEDISNILKEHQKKMGIHYTDETREELLIHTLILVKRVQLGKFIKNYKECYIDMKELQSIKKLLRGLQEKYKIKFTDSEINYLSRILAGAKLVGNFNENRIDYKLDFEINTLIDWMVEGVNQYLGICIKEDKEFLEGMMSHLELAIYRLKNNLEILNPLTDKIKYRYPFIFDISKKIAVNYERLLECEIPEGEVAYIAMYIGAAFERTKQSGFLPRALIVCGSGFATSNMLITRLNIMLPELNILGPVSPEQINHMLCANEIDFIITTVNLNVKKSKVILVNPLLENSDIQKLKELIFYNTKRKQVNYISKQTLEKDISQNLVSLKDLLHADNISLRQNCNNWKEAIRRACIPLLNNRNIDSCYVDAAIGAVEKYGPYMVFIPEIAFVHASPKSGVNRDCISMMTLEKPVAFSSKSKDQVSIIFVFGTNKADKHFKVLSKLVNILENRKNIELLKTSRSIEEVLEISS